MPWLRTSLAQPGAVRRRPGPAVPRRRVAVAVAGQVPPAKGDRVARRAEAQPTSAKWALTSVPTTARGDRCSDRARWWIFSPRPRRCAARHRSRRQRRSLHRAEDSVVAGNPVIGRDALGEQVRIQRVGTESVLAHRQWHVRLVAVADFDGRRALTRVTHARIVAGTADRHRRILREFAIQPVRCVDVAQVVRGSPGVGWHEADRANRRIVDRECEVAMAFPSGWFSP